MAAHPELVDEIKKACQRFWDKCKEDGEMSDEEGRTANELENWIANGFMDLFEQFGFEIGDERVD
jgi:hypothetical protein